MSRFASEALRLSRGSCPCNWPKPPGDPVPDKWAPVDLLKDKAFLSAVKLEKVGTDLFADALAGLLDQWFKSGLGKAPSKLT